VSGDRRHLDALSSRILAVHEMLDALHVEHQFGGAIALAWYRSPRATTDVDVNVTLSPENAEPLLGALGHLGVSVTAEDRALIERDGQARLDWGGYYLDVFFATLELHREMAVSARNVAFGPAHIPILSPEHLIVCKAVFDRPKDWVDIEEIVALGTQVDPETVLGWIDELLGEDSVQHERLAHLLVAIDAPASGASGQPIDGEPPDQPNE
jgi:hypothetical protein